MASHIDELLQKINEDGIRAAEEKAKSIEETAKAKAEEILKKAKSEAKHIVAQAKEETSRFQANAEATLRQASRNVIIEVRNSIIDTFNRLLARRTEALLNSKDFANILSAAVKSFIEKGGKVSDIQLLLNDTDLKRLEQGLIADLVAEIKKGIEIKRAGDIHSGFIVSFDKGSSCYDFSDEALAEFLFKALGSKIESILAGSNGAGQKEGDG